MRNATVKKAALLVLLIMVVLGIAYPALAPFHPDDFSFPALLPPGGKHLLGTNKMGQDIFSALLAGFRVTISIALIVSFCSTLIGTVLAISCAFYRRWMDRFIMSVTEIFIIVPEIIVIMLFAAFAGPRVADVVMVMIFFSWSRITRILRGKAMVIINQDTVQYTLLLKGNLLDVGRKMWPYFYPAVTTLFIQQCGRAAVYEATLSFLGIGDPALKSWGRTIRAALDYEGIFWDHTYLWWLLPPILCLVLFVLALALLTFDFDEESESAERSE